MKILTINCGSSSVKYALFDQAQKKRLARGIVEPLSLQFPTKATLNHQVFGEANREWREELGSVDYLSAVNAVFSALQDPKAPVLEGPTELFAVGHRVVHGGEAFSHSVLINEEVVATIQKNIPLAPLHNPANLAGILAINRWYKEQGLVPPPQVAVFDTAFHQTLPEVAYRYALPEELYQKYRIRRYGFHGTSHRFTSQRARELLRLAGRSDRRLITLHLGAGCSVSAVFEGRSVDTSMGFTPLEGLVMATRSGDLDPAVVLYLQREIGLSWETVDRLLNYESGWKGLSGLSSDMRTLLSAREEGHPGARLAVDIFTYRVRKYIGGYAAVLGGLDALVFTGGIGENSPTLRKEICSGLDFLGISLDETANSTAIAREAALHTPSSPVAIWVIPTDEERLIAEETASLVGSSQGRCGNPSGPLQRGR